MPAFGPLLQHYGVVVVDPAICLQIVLYLVSRTPSMRRPLPHHASRAEASCDTDLKLCGVMFHDRVSDDVHAVHTEGWTHSHC